MAKDYTVSVEVRRYRCPKGHEGSEETGRSWTEPSHTPAMIGSAQPVMGMIKFHGHEGWRCEKCYNEAIQAFHASLAPLMEKVS